MTVRPAFHPPPTAVRAGLLVLLLALVVKTAWVGDDAYITLRTADNFLGGHGLTWNVGERVQSFTHPLWLFVLIAVKAVVGDGWATLLTAGFLATTAACVLFLWRIASSPGQAALAVGALAFSKYWVDYCTSGLATPLLYLLVAWFALLWFELREAPPARRGRGVFVLVLAAALCGLTRLDSLLLVGPPLAVALVREGPRRHWRAVLLGVLPLVLWELFAIVYYGTPLPNTYYAKLHTGIPLVELLDQGLRYFAHALRTDPLMMLVLAAGLAATCVRAGPGEWSFGLGLVLTLVYILRVGGDFMAGRFFTVPFFLALCLLARRPLPPPRLRTAAAVVLAAALLVPRNAVTAAWIYDWSPDVDGIGDERGYYSPHNGLLARLRDDHVEHRGVRDGKRLRRLLADRPGGVGAGETAGMTPYHAGPKLHMVDRFALTDAFLARLPISRTRFAGDYRHGWRIGHFYRELPEGYEESVGTDRNLLQDPELAELYRNVRLVTTGPLFTAERWRAIWWLNLRSLRGP